MKPIVIEPPDDTNPELESSTVHPIIDEVDEVLSMAVVSEEKAHPWAVNVEVSATIPFEPVLIELSIMLSEASCNPMALLLLVKSESYTVVD